MERRRKLYRSGGGRSLLVSQSNDRVMLSFVCDRLVAELHQAPRDVSAVPV